MGLLNRIRHALSDPAPAPVADAVPDDLNALAQPQQRGPSTYYNPFLGIGTARDPSFWDGWCKPRALSETQREAMARNALIRRALALKADDATREGWSVDIDTTDLGDVDPTVLADAIQDYEDREHIALGTKISDAILRADLYQFAIIVLGIDDGTGDSGFGADLSQPVDVTAIKTIAWARVFDARDVDIAGIHGIDEDEFGTPTAFVITDIQGVLPDGFRPTQGAGYSTTLRSQVPQPPGVGEILVHASRVLYFQADDAIPVPDKMAWHFANYFKAMSAISRGASEFAQTIYRIKDWAWKSRNRDSGASLERVSALERMRGLFNAVILDSETEDYERSSGAVAGLEKMSNPSMVDICAALGIPVTVFFMVSPGGFGTGASEIEIYNAAVLVWQTRKLKTPLRKAHGYMLLAEDGPQIEIRPESREIVFASLTPTDDTETQGILTARATLVITAFEKTVIRLDEARATLESLNTPEFSFKLEELPKLSQTEPGAAPAPGEALAPDGEAPGDTEDVPEPEPEPDPLAVALSADPLPSDAAPAKTLAGNLSAKLGTKVPTGRITKAARAGQVRSWRILGAGPVLHSEREIMGIIARENGIMDVADTSNDEIGGS